MYIKIIKGNYGLTNGASVKLKTPRDKPFEVADEEALRLKMLGIAEIFKVNDNSASDDTSKGDNHSEVGDTPKEEYAPEDGRSSEKEEDNGIPKYGAGNTNAELLAIAEEYGIGVPSRASKAQIIEALDSYFGDMPVLTAKEPEE